LELSCLFVFAASSSPLLLSLSVVFLFFPIVGGGASSGGTHSLTRVCPHHHHLQHKQAIERVGYANPSPIQRAAIPLGLKQLDVIGIAETGSGKTAAFVLPLLSFVLKQPPMTEENSGDGPYAVVLAPTRELAQQIDEETVKLAHYTPFKSTCVVGGQSIEEQGVKLRRGCEVVVATPGRLLDCLERRYAVLAQCNYVVLDEADRMIDLGFEPQVNAVLEAMPSSSLKPEDEAVELEAGRVYRTTYMFSATMPPAVERLARKFLRRPVVVTIGSVGMASDNVSQRVVMLKENDKPHRLTTELDMVRERRVIVFVNTKRQCDHVHRHLDGGGYRCAVLHGGKTQDQREAAIATFKRGDASILIATDVAGRGIDIADVELVINYDMPTSIEPYTHRIGRTGRAGKKGEAVTFLTLSDADVFYDLKKQLEASRAPVPAELARHEASRQKPEARGGGGGGGGGAMGLRPIT
jgi:ATP-dependent RNA helicase DDX23/PRP28